MPIEQLLVGACVRLEKFNTHTIKETTHQRTHLQTHFYCEKLRTLSNQTVQ